MYSIRPRLIPLLALVLGLGWLAEAALAGGVGSAAFPDGGVLRLETGATDQWVWSKAPSSPQPIGSQSSGGAKCWLTQHPTDPMMLVAAGPTGYGFQPGLVGHSIGVWGGGNSTQARGTACSRVSGREVLVLKVGLADHKVWKTKLDIEVKQNARIFATPFLGNVAQPTFELRSGGSIITGEGFDDPGSRIFNCRKRSDSGPDSGSADNCTWEFEALYDELHLTTDDPATTAVDGVGEFSLEGGGDWAGEAGNNRSEFHLKVAGTLSCPGQGQDSTGLLEEGIDTAITRTGVCSESILYSLDHRVISGADLNKFVDFFTSNNDSNQKFIVDIIWAREPRPANLSILLPTKYSVDGINFNEVPLCVGTPTFNGSDEVVDLNPGIPVSTPYACILERTVIYRGPTLSPEIQVHETIYLQGDPTFGRK